MILELFAGFVLVLIVRTRNFISKIIFTSKTSTLYFLLYKK